MDGSGGNGLWFTHIDGAQGGPFEAGEVQRQFMSGKLKAMDGVWQAGWPAWKPAGEVFKGLVVPPPMQPFVSPPPQAAQPAATAPSAAQSTAQPVSGLVGDVWIGARKIEIYRYTGVVVDLQRSSTTHVSGGGSGPNGTVNPITSRTVNTHEAFIRLPDGSERTLDVEPSGVPVRPGNTVTVLLGIRKGKTNGWYTAVWNHQSKRMGFLPWGINKLAGPPFRHLTYTALWLLLVLGLMLNYGAARHREDPTVMYLALVALVVQTAVMLRNRRKLRAAMAKAIADVKA